LHSACNKRELETLCHACQLGRHVRLPFSSSNSRASANFDLIHCDLWTSPIPSVSGYKYYLIILDDCSHYSWTFPLRLKSDTFPCLSNFFSYVTIQFGTTIKVVQCDNGREFDNSTTRAFLHAHGTVIRMSCPHTSPQMKLVYQELYSLYFSVSSASSFPLVISIYTLLRLMESVSLSYFSNRNVTREAVIRQTYYSQHW
jgi:hypothetical protein